MAQTNYKAPFKKALWQFLTEPDPFLAMLEWVMTEMMRIESEAKVGANKEKHTTERKTYFSGDRVRRVDTRLGTDADWIVKVIDVYPDSAPDPKSNPGNIRMGGYQRLVRGEVFRGKFRNSYEKSEPFPPWPGDKGRV